MKIITKEILLQNGQTRVQSRNFLIKFFVLICLNFIFTNAYFSQTPDPKLLELRNRFAVDYLKPEAHFALSRYYLEKGNKVQAFYILEYARRYRFSEEVFDSAFVKFFGDNSPEPSDEAKDNFEEAYRLLNKNKTDEAEKFFIKAANLAPKSGMIHGWVGRFYLKVKKDNDKALKYYYDAYFLDPHAYDTEYAESRIRNIIYPAAEVRFKELVKAGKSLPELSKDENPLIVMRAMEAMIKNWKPEYSQFLYGCLENDDSMVRWAAFTILNKNPDISRDELILKLTDDGDLRKKGLAAYAIVERGKEKDFEILKEMLADKAELIRFDAVSALVLKGGEKGKEILREHQKVEVNPLLKDMLNQELQKKQVVENRQTSRNAD